jgi:hypothetical protein
MATIGQTLTSPESGWKRYDDKNSALKYTGTVVKNGGGSFYLTTGTSLEGIGDKLSFSFTGTKLTIMVYGDSGSSFSIMIDGVNEGVCKAFGYGVNKVVVAYTTETLSDTKHKVELTMLDYNSVGGNKQRVIFDAIDIDENGRLYHPDEVINLKDLDIGKRIRCHYQAPSGVVGGFSGLGQETSDFIPTTSSATPNGDFYFIMVEDWNGEKRLIADRIVQHSISWDTLNSAGVAAGSGLPIQIDSLTGYKFVVRLLTGGVSSTDKDNEWDRYIVNSTLNGAITAGDNTVWNWNVPIYSWTSTTGSTVSSRVIRGYNSNSTWSQATQGTSATTNGGFRPVILIEPEPSINKSFILFDGRYKKWENGWQTVSTTLPSVDTFINEGMDDLSVFDRKSITINVPMDDNTPSGEVLGSGRVFKEKVDLKKLIQINSIKIK